MENYDIYVEDRIEDETINIQFKDRDAIEIFLNKGSSFGSKHTTTLLAIESLKFIFQKDGQIVNSLDLGSGSGILSILIKKLGGRFVDSCEIDEFAKMESIKNFKSNINKDLDLPSFVEAPLLKIKQYNLIVANISGRFLPDNFPRISKIIKPNGYLIISGFNLNKEEKYVKLLKDLNCLMIHKFTKKPWISMIFKK